MNNPIRMQRAEANPKTNILMMSIIVLTGLAALFLDTEVVDHTPQILASIPSALDLRVLPSFKKCDFSIKEEGVCIGASWALSISQTFSDLMSIRYNETLTYSAQELLECATEDQSTLCHSTDITRIQAALAYIQSKGISKDSCYPFNPILNPKKCSKVCPSNNQTIVRDRATVTELQRDAAILANQIGNYGPILMAIEFRDSMNYYSSGVLKNEGELYGLLVMEVIGWKEQGKVLLAKSNFGTYWGMNGVAQVSLSDPSIKALYALSFKTQQEM